MVKKDWSQHLDMLLRFRLIEILVFWEGRISSTTLVKAFGIGRQQGTKNIHRYIDEVCDSNLLYDAHIKGYRPTENFQPILTKGTVDEYLYLLHSCQDLDSRFSYLDIQKANTEVIFPLHRKVNAQFIRPIVQAARTQQRIEIDYMSITSGAIETRVISPHTLVYSGYRWHIRAHCEKHNDYRDFVLSRINDIPVPVTISENGMDEDKAWNTQIELIIKPDPRLSPFQKKIIQQEYNMTNGQLNISTRAALANYHLHYLRISSSNNKEPSPEAQQLVLANHEQIKQWLF